MLEGPGHFAATAALNTSHECQNCWSR